jgi:hypothetical protein
MIYGRSLNNSKIKLLKLHQKIIEKLTKKKGTIVGLIFR